MIGSEATDWLVRLKRLLRQRGAAPETVAVMADTLGPMCDKCLQAMDKSIQED